MAKIKFNPKYLEQAKDFHEKYKEAQISIEVEGENSLNIYLETNRLELHNVSLNDLDNYYKYLYSVPTLMSSFAAGVTSTEEELKERIKDVWQDRTKNGIPYTSLAIELKEEEYIALTKNISSYINNINPSDRSTFIGQVALGAKYASIENSSEIAYLVSHNHQKQNYGKEAVGAVVFDYAKYLAESPDYYNKVPTQNTNLETLFATARQTNIGSQTILKSLGFHMEDFKSTILDKNLNQEVVRDCFTLNIGQHELVLSGDEASE